MRELKNGVKIIGIDHGYGNIKTANTVTPTGVAIYDDEPVFAGNILHDTAEGFIVLGRVTSRLPRTNARTSITMCARLWEAHKNCGKIFETLGKYEYNSELMRLWVVGRGGCIIKNFGKFDKARVNVIYDICALANGY